MRVAFATLVILLLLPSVACAHRDDYLDETFVYVTLGRHEVEIEGWAEARRDTDHRTVGWYTGAFEYGISSHWMADGAAQILHRGDEFQFGRLRLETRARFAEEGRWPLDVAASTEFEHETRASTGGESEDVLTPRLVLSRDVSRELNTTLNLDFPVRLSGAREATFAYALGVRYPAETVVRVGTELKGDPSEHRATVFPQAWFALPKGLTLKFGTGIGLTSRTDRWVARAVAEIEL
ncbi:MAG: hypothetical protein E6K76_11630 [Candidatus Eisenbacteria bacterium]|uniref:DUF2490 domain-containing protein n=1 Tax=Eiseniibacteriota bacterium TaxID=2212470 RepID=A0A538T0D0_UNCEI|nr:MAG: hypothetical protein E6K76_11630 [Candidatus Eisenbacteria bacterium]